MKTLLYILGFTLLVSTVGYSQALEPSQERSVSVNITQDLAPIKKKRHLRLLEAEPSALDVLSPNARQEFIDGIVFSKRGIGGANLKPLADLSPIQQYSVLALFGLQNNMVYLRDNTKQSRFGFTPWKGTWGFHGGDDLHGFVCVRDKGCKKQLGGYVCNTSACLRSIEP